jgi:hypothetical protein
MDSEPKKQQIDEKAMLDEWWKQTNDELDAEEDRLNPSVEDDDIDRLEWEHEMRENEQKEMDIEQGMWEDFGGSEPESEEDSDEDEEEDEDDDYISELFKGRIKGRGRA